MAWKKIRDWLTQEMNYVLLTETEETLKLKSPITMTENRQGFSKNEIIISIEKEEDTNKILCSITRTCTQDNFTLTMPTKTILSGDIQDIAEELSCNYED